MVLHNDPCKLYEALKLVEIEMNAHSLLRVFKFKESEYEFVGHLISVPIDTSKFSLPADQFVTLDIIKN